MDCASNDIQEEEEEEEERLKVRELVRREVEDWDDPVKAVARFKGFSGQRSDWEGRYLFWRDLIIKVARHLGTFIIRPSRLNNIWFRREGALSPLCLHQVLFEMHNAGELLRDSDLTDPTRTSTSPSGRLSLILRKAMHTLGFSTPAQPSDFSEDCYCILSTLLKERALQVVQLLSENHWTSSCVITLTKFQETCGGPKEASAVLSYLSGCGKAKYLVVRKKDVMEGVKVSLSSGEVSEVTSLDYHVLHLMWTVDKLEQQLEVIDQRCRKSKSSAVGCLKSGNRRIALRHARELKLAFQSREKCTLLLNRVEEVLRVIADAESSRKVSEAMKVGAEAMRENKISIEEVDLCLEDLDTSIRSINQVDELLVSAPLSAVLEDEDIDDELKILELEIGEDSSGASISKNGVDSVAAVAEESETVDSLSDALSNLNFKGSAATKAVRKRLSPSSTEVLSV
ncbi:unnamed protein product [Coffea canephora]|uniref:Charged multivesicular body protein 7 n=1 Tax=Coffea canephora TaxID=49390 RepID=A0A068V958_COFCA|nr:unnamed protein product [Coffea canephora]